MTEKIHHTDDQIRITSSIVEVNNTTYPVRNITSVSIGKADDGQISGCLAILMLLSIGISCFAILCGIGDGFSATTFGFIFFPLLIGIILFFLAGMHERGIPHELYLETSSGRTRALTSKDKRYLESLKQHVTTAITEYR